jgi:hypothetical protein
MKTLILRTLGAFVLLMSASALTFTSRADSIELRDGRHLQGKYVGGTSGVIAFMTRGAVEYLNTADVLVLVFDNSGADSPLGQFRPSAGGDEPVCQAPKQSARQSVKQLAKKKHQTPDRNLVLDETGAPPQRAGCTT